MSDKPISPITPGDGLRHTIPSKAARKLRRQAQGDRSIWFGIGTFGVVGWSVALPTLLGALVGVWIDRHYPGPHSWTLALLVAGLTVGCAQAWHWVSRQEKEIRKQEKNDHE